VKREGGGCKKNYLSAPQSCGTVLVIFPFERGEGKKTNMAAKKKTVETFVLGLSGFKTREGEGWTKKEFSFVRRERGT